MKYKLLGKSGLRVSELALGAMSFGQEWGWGSSKEESKKVFDTYANEGGNFIDTANRYTEGTSEKFVGEFIKPDRDHFVIATKYTLFMRRDDPNFSGNHRKNMMLSVEASLKRLKTDYIDLYWLHAWDFTTPVEEVLRGLDDLVSSGKILYIGISDTPAWIISHANTISELRGWNRFVALQIKYSLLERTVERDLLPMARYFDMAVTAWSALGTGVLTGKYNRKENRDDDRVARAGGPNKTQLKIAEEVIKIADELNVTPSQVALAWMRQQPGLIIPIVGARNEKQLKENLGCINVTLTEEHLKRLDEISKIELGFPHDFLAKENIRDLIYGGTYEKIINHHKF